MNETKLSQLRNPVNDSDSATKKYVDDNVSDKYIKPTNGIPKEDLEESVQDSLDKADTALQSFTETDPTVPSWAKAANKPSYTASEVGALPNTVTSLKNPFALTIPNGISTDVYDGSVAKTINIPNATTSNRGLIQIGNTANQAMPGNTVIPTVYDSLITLKQNGEIVGTFTVNSTNAIELELTTPVNTSDLTNDSGYITSSSIPTKLPNPNSLTIPNGTGTDTYDGSVSKNIVLPDASTTNKGIIKIGNTAADALAGNTHIPNDPRYQTLTINVQDESIVYTGNSINPVVWNAVEVYNSIELAIQASEQDPTKLCLVFAQQ